MVCITYYTMQYVLHTPYKVGIAYILHGMHHIPATPVCNSLHATLIDIYSSLHQGKQIKTIAYKHITYIYSVLYSSTYNFVMYKWFVHMFINIISLHEVNLFIHHHLSSLFSHGKCLPICETKKKHEILLPKKQNTCTYILNSNTTHTNKIL